MLKNLYASFTKNNIIKDSDIFLRESVASQDIEPHRPPKEEFKKLIGKEDNYPEIIGAHPDFEHLGLDDEEYHYITSVFIDIKGSTNLAMKLPLEQVRFIKNGILTTAIDVFQVFDGHIHRLQGDAVFAQFGRKDMNKEDSIIDSLNAASFLQSYFSNYLSSIFEKKGFPSIKVRIGIDFGDTEEVLWTNYGIQNVNEITTTSIHTDLAAKLESNAPANCIMIGDSIKEYLDLPDEFCKIKTIQRESETVKDRYVINNDYLTYKMWQFDWEKYLSYFSFLENKTTSCPYKSPDFFEIKCYYKLEDESEYNKEYRSSCKSLPKGTSLKYKLKLKRDFNYDNIIWEVNNRGEEAQENDQIKFTVDQYEGKDYCYESTAYKGHHYMKCKIKYQNRVVGIDNFGIYVRD
jgi:class 3 adenylate cyclase